MLKRLFLVSLFLVPLSGFAGAGLDFDGIFVKENGAYILRDTTQNFYNVQNCFRSQRVQITFGNMTKIFAGTKALTNIFESAKIHFSGGVTRVDSPRLVNPYCISGGNTTGSLPKITIASIPYTVTSERYMSQIALQYAIYSEDEVQLLEKWNKLRKNQPLKEGQIVYIPQF